MSFSEAAFVTLIMAIAYLTLVCAKRFAARRLASKFLKSLSQDPTGHQYRRNPTNRIVFDDLRFGVVSKDDPATTLGEMRWNDVQLVFAQKKDLLIVDQNCLSFKDRATTVEVNDEMESFIDFTELLPRYLVGCKRWSEWFLFAEIPAFDTTPTLFFVRKSDILNPENER
jgi:hypothetical protein